MGIFTKKPRKKFQPSRKQQRKEKRKEKKLRKNDFFSHKRIPGQYVINPNSNQTASEAINKENMQSSPDIKKSKIQNLPIIKQPKVLTSEEISKKESKQQRKLEKQMVKQRNKQLLDANKEEDKIIKQLEKQLGLTKRKSKTLPKSFTEDGLDYLLEVCDPEIMKHASAAEKELHDYDDFEEDFQLMTGNSSKKLNLKNNEDADNDESEEEFYTGEQCLAENEDSDSNEDKDDVGTEISDGDYIDDNQSVGEEDIEQFNDDKDTMDALKSRDQHQEFNKTKANKRKKESNDMMIVKKQNDGQEVEEISDDNYSDDDHSEEEETENSFDNEDTMDALDSREKGQQTELNKTKAKKRKRKCKDIKMIKNQIEEHFEDSTSDSDNENNDYDDDDDDNDVPKKIKGAVRVNDDGTWEDIYGRLRAKDGSILTGNEPSKYVPPAARDKLADHSGKRKDSEKIIRLKRQLKGFLNRLAESNMHSIANQIEQLYMNHSRNDMNDTLTTLMLESLVTEIITPERLLIEHILLISILHANVGTEIGAHFLQTVIKKFDDSLKSHRNIENKTLDNVVLLIAQLYNFKIFDAKLLYEILMKLAKAFDEKCIECILHILRTVGFTLRKDDPIALKNLILDLQKRAASVSNEDKDYSRIRFMLEIVLAIKNNNVTKIPNYDVSYSEHLKKIMKGLIRKGNYVTQLNISLEDLLKAEEKGRWWVVGSAWSGNDQAKNVSDESSVVKTQKFSVKLLALAKKQRMNTDTRRNIFCIIMSAEDYMDAFEKLLKLGLKNQQEREIINIILHCCLQEKNYNPYYAHLAQKFCDYDRKYQMIIKYSVWDKLKALNEHSGYQISNLAKLLIHLFIEKGLPISTLKIMQFSELDKLTLRFMRQILIGIILHEDTESCLAVFAKVSVSDKLKMFRESLRLFIHHFLLKNLKTGSLPDDQKVLLEERAKLVEKVLASREHRL